MVSTDAAAELAPQVVHVGVDDDGVLGLGEDQREQLGAGEHAARAAGEGGQQRALAVGERDRSVADAGDLAGVEVKEPPSTGRARALSRCRRSNARSRASSSSTSNGLAR